MRKCEFCGCSTNAKLRMCCAKGYLADGGHEPLPNVVWLDNRKGQAEFVLICLAILGGLWGWISMTNPCPGFKYQYKGYDSQRLDRIEQAVASITITVNGFTRAPDYTMCPVCARRNMER